MTAEIEQWKSLVNCLPGVLGVEFHLENDTVREVHILSDQSRGPKQIVRDVQSALLAKYQLELDHRIISVAQIPSPPQENSRRIIFKQLDLKTSRDGITVAVYLQRGDDTYEGHTHCSLASTARIRAIAHATVEALNQLLLAGCRFSVADVRSTTLSDHPVVLVGVALKLDGKAESLLGACYVGDDPNASVIMATLDAVNRRLLTLPPASSAL